MAVYLFIVNSYKNYPALARLACRIIYTACGFAVLATLGLN